MAKPNVLKNSSAAIPDGNSESSGQSEVSELEFPGPVVDEEVLRLQVSVQDVPAVAVGQPAEKLKPEHQKKSRTVAMIDNIQTNSRLVKHIFCSCDKGGRQQS